MDIKRGSKSFYVGDSEEHPLAIMTYRSAGDDRIIVDHTIISEELKGQGVGKLLLTELVAWVRKEKKKVIPECPFVKAQMEKNKEYHDVMIAE